MSSKKTVTYKGFRLPPEAVRDIKEAGQIWRTRDKDSWLFAERAHKIVGKYIPDATLALAREMNVESPTTPQGYAKAWELLLDLLIIGHHAPLKHLFISHYITVGKSYHAGTITTEDADLLLREASRFEKPVRWIRSKLKGKMGDDSWRDSAYRLKEYLTVHIINAPYTGVQQEKASLVAWLGKAFVKVLDWALLPTPIESNIVGDVMKDAFIEFLSNYNIGLPEEEEEVSLLETDEEWEQRQKKKNNKFYGKI